MREFSDRKHLVVFGLCCILALVWTVSERARAQVLYGSIAGNVVDQTAAAIPGAEVTILSLETNFTQSTITNETGSFTLKNVPDGIFKLTVSLTGFKEFVAENVTVTVGNVTRQDVVLEVGQITETVTVSSAATLLQTDTTDVRAQLEEKEIEDLPLSQYKNYQSLINLVPGATPARFQNAITDTPGRALTTNVNGTARNNNNTRIDGAMSVNIWLPHHSAIVPPSETVEVVNISTNNFDAEQGFAGGAAITVVTKSGTNDFHGSAFLFHENASLNARDFFNFLDADGDGKADKPAGRRNITGGTLGGPIVKDKLFFFGGYEGTFQGRSTSSVSTLPTADQRAGDFSAFLPDASGNCPAGSGCTVIYDPATKSFLPDGTQTGTAFPGNIIPANRLSPQATAIQNLLPLPNLSGLTQNFEIGGQEIMNRSNYDAKVDWYRSDRHRLWGKFSWMDAEVRNRPKFGEAGGGAIGSLGDGVGNTDVKVYGVGHNWTLSPNFLIDGNFGFTDMDQEVLGADIDKENFGQDVLGIPGTNSTPEQEQACIVNGFNRCGGVPRFSVSGFSTFGQSDGWTPIFRDENSLTFTQNFSLSKGNHEFRWGYDVVKHMLNHWQPEIGAGPRGRFNFSRNVTALKGGAGGTDQNAWAGFVLGLPSFAGKSLQWELMTANEWQHAWYFRDRWQVTPKLTLTLGLRYEFYPLVSRDDRNMEFLNLANIIPCPADDTAPGCFETVLDNNIDVSKHLLAPRLGLAYRLSDNDVIRTGYGITYSPIPFARPLRGFFPLTIAGDFPVQDSFVASTTLADGIPIFGGPDTSPGARIPLPSFVQMRTMPPDRIQRGYIQSWNLVYERKLPSDFVVSLGYVGTQTTNQLADNQINWSPPGGGTTGRQLYPFSTTTVRFWDGWLSSNYHSLQVSVNRRFTNGLFVKGAYTYSRAINMTDDEGWAGLNWNDPALLGRNRAQAGYNRPHVLQLATVYELPFGRGGSGFGNLLVRDWQVNGIFSANQNSPFTVGSSSPINTRNNSQTADQVKAEVQNLGGIGNGDPYYDPTAFATVNRVPGADCTNFDCYGSSGRNILRGPTWVNLDLSLFRNFRLTEETKLEFRTEFFNLTNTPHFNNPTSSASSSRFMQILSTSSNAPERVIRFALKLKF
ncbi:MAG: TonB-dependent receptor domain-containing protein [Acidobacteriota bacterium]